MAAAGGGGDVGGVGGGSGRNRSAKLHAMFANVCGALGENDKTKGTHKETTQHRVSRNNTTSYFSIGGAESSSALFKPGYYLTTYTLSL